MNPFFEQVLKDFENQREFKSPALYKGRDGTTAEIEVVLQHGNSLEKGGVLGTTGSATIAQMWITRLVAKSGDAVIVDGVEWRIGKIIQAAPHRIIYEVSTAGKVYA